MSTVTLGNRPNPDSIGVWLAKWVVVPLLALLIPILLVRVEIGKYKCRKLAAAHGYMESMYVPSRFYDPGDQCFCRKKRRADGSIDETAEMVINIGAVK